MSSASTLPYARDALVTKLGARSGLSGVKVLRDLPRSDTDWQSDGGAYEVIWIGRQGQQAADFDTSTPFLTAGAPRWDETYTMWATIQVLKLESVDTIEAAQERAWALAYEFIGAVSADLTSGRSSTRPAAGKSSKWGSTASAVSASLEPSPCQGSCCPRSTVCKEPSWRSSLE